MKKTKTKLAIIASLVVLLLWSVFPSPRTVIKGNKTINSNLVLKDGMISPGNSPGKVTVDGDLTLGSSATYKCELKDLTGAGTGHDQIDATGNISLDGTLDIVLDGYTPNDADKFEIMKYGGAVSGTFSTITGLPTGWQIDYGVEEPTKVTIYGPASPLPVELINFTGTRQNKSIELTWQTASEQRSDYFDVEYSNNAKDFSKLGKLKAKGSSTTMQDYSLTHEHPSIGTNYYRLKQVDFDGEYTYSRIVSVKFDKTNITFFPNPATETITFSQPCESIVIYDLSGREVLRAEHVESVLDLSELNTGVYMLEVNHGEIKQKLVIGK